MKYKAAFDSAGTELGTPSLIIKPHFTDGKRDTKKASYFLRAPSLHPNSTLEKPDFLPHSNVTNKQTPSFWLLLAREIRVNEKSGSYLYGLLLGMCSLKDTAKSGFTFYQVHFLQYFKNVMGFSPSFWLTAQTLRRKR